MKKEKFIIPLYDTTIKYLIKSKRTGPIIFKLLYSLTGIDLTDYIMIDQELNTGNTKTKDYRLDFLFKKGMSLINLEINYELSDWSRRKGYNYLWRLSGSGYGTGGKYTAKEVIHIAINNASFKENKTATLLEYRFKEDDYNTIIPGVKSYEIYLKNYSGIKYNGHNEIETLLSMLTATSKEEMQEIVGNYKEGEIIMSELEKLSLNDEFNIYYDHEAIYKKDLNEKYDEGRESGLAEGRKSGLAEGRKSGLAEGSNKEKLAIAKLMLQGKESLDKIVKYTGLSINQLNTLL